MTKLRKQRRKKVYRHNVNRKRLRNKIQGVGKIVCNELDVAWDQHKSIQTNLGEMGLAYDPNETIKIQTNKKKLKAILKSSAGEWEQEHIDTKPTKAFVAEALEKDAKAPRAKLFRLPKGQIEWITYLMDKYGTDYRAMTRDRKNYQQETWKQLRAKIKKFKNIPEQYSAYLKSKNLSEGGVSDNCEELTDDEL